MNAADGHGVGAPGLARRIAEHASTSPGPTLIVVGGLHANEPAGIEAAQRVHARLDDRELACRAGRLVSLRGNLAALSLEAPEPWLRDRYIDHDLNRLFDESSAASGDGSAEHHERAELVGELRGLVAESRGAAYLLDLHTVSSASPAFIALEDSLPARRFASGLPLPKILGLEEELAGLMMDYATNRLGCVSCIVEAGRHDDPRSADVHEAVVLLAMATLGMLPRSVRTTAGEVPRDVVTQAAGGRAGHFYDVRERVAVGGPDYAMQPGAMAFMPVRAGKTVLAVQDARPITASVGGLLFLPNRQASVRIGDDAFFVIARVGRVWLTLSAWLRQRAWVHRWTPRLLPGVRAREGEPHAIVVAPEYAVILRREVLHLLGYRVVRWTPTPRPPRPRRIAGLAGALVRAVAGLLRFAPRGGERAALPGEQPTDWIARRHRLDVAPRPSIEEGSQP